MRLDIAFLVGAYGPDAEAIFRKQKEFIVTFLRSYEQPIRSGQIRVAIISYGSAATIAKNFNENSAVESIESLTNGLRLQRGFAVDSALSVASNDVFSQPSSGRRKVLLLFTDFTSNDNKDMLRTAMQMLRSQGVSVIALGAGNKVNIPNLITMASSSNDALLAESSKTMMFYYYEVYRRIVESK